jgi:membrane-bound lytic murein transglycosylase MltF
MPYHPLLYSNFLASAIFKRRPLSSPASRSRNSQLAATALAFCALLFVITGCNTKPAPPQATDQAKQEQPAPATPPSSSDLLPSQDAVASAQSGKGAGLTLPLAFAKHIGDLDDMVKRRTIRALVIIDPISFFYQNGQPKGVTYEALEEFQKFVNDKFKTGTLKVKVVYTPLRPDQMEAALNEGIGDIVATPVVITPEREQKVAFTAPLAQHVTQLIVTGPSAPGVSSFDDLAGKEIYANPVTTYYDNLNKLNAERQKAGKAPFIVKAADKNLLDDDLVEMVNAGLIPATVTTKMRAGLWTQVFPSLTAHQDMTTATEGSVAWALRKNNPQLKALLDEFIQTHGIGTSFGNTLQRRYLQNTKWIKNSTNTEELQKFNANIQFFKQYATEYNFDYLMLAAQGYQESLLDQSRKNPSGAVGIMQVIPKYAAAKPIGVTNVNVAEGNIHAGAKMMRNIADTYFNDPAIDQKNKTLMSFASYNAGPNRIARLRKKAVQDGLDPNIWFGNVELEVAKDIGQETVTYVSNIYKYYVAYTLALAQHQDKQAAMAAAKGN